MNGNRNFIWLFGTIMALTFTFGCKAKQGGGAKFEESLSTEVRETCAIWKADPLGCKKDRTAYHGEAIVAAFFPLKPDEASIEKMLGEAETESSRNGIKTLTYYFDTRCENGKIRENSVYCVVDFRINESTGKLETAGVSCG